MRPMRVLLVLSALWMFSVRPAYGAIQTDFSDYRKESGVKVLQQQSLIFAEWPIGPAEVGKLTLDLTEGSPLISAIADVHAADGNALPILSGVDPVYLLTVGTRDLHAAAGWVAFFDDPPKRPHQSFVAQRRTQKVKVVSEGHHTSIILDGVTAGSFHGDLRFTLYPGTRLIQAEAVLTTEQDSCAILYDTGITSASPQWKTSAFVDDHDQWRHIELAGEVAASPESVRNRTILCESGGGSIAIFPPPHQYFYPLDFVDNFGFVWHGKNFRDVVNGYGAGIRQTLDGDKRHVPWVNAPPGTFQRLGVFYLIDSGKAEQTLHEVQRYTRADTFKHLDGYLTFTSHYHVEHTLAYLAAQEKQKTTGIPAGLEDPDFVKVFKARGVDIAHLAEFHDDMSRVKVPRLAYMKIMHEECRRLSDEHFLLLPGEEPDVHLGGHWISLFPKPVYWTLQRTKGQPFMEQVEGYGSVYHVGSSDDVLKLMEAEHGLMWTAHPRIKASFGFPDHYKSQPFFQSDRFLGAAWKAMPADNSLPRLGMRVLDLLDDMSNWGEHKYVLGEVDVFKISAESELYGPMNINYIKLDKLPRFDQGWQSVLDALHDGKMFVTTGEVLIPSCTIDGKSGGEILHSNGNNFAELAVSLEWTFPLSFAEIVSGDGEKVYRQRIELNQTDAFGSRTLKIPLNLSGRKWARFEVWDVATNGAFTEPVWIE